MTLDVDVGKTSAVGRVKQFSSLREVEQDIRLGWLAPETYFVACLGERLVERGHPATCRLQLCPQRLERGEIVLLERRKRRQYLWRERRAGVDLGLLDQPLQRIADLLGAVDGGCDGLFVVGPHVPTSSR